VRRAFSAVLVAAALALPATAGADERFFAVPVNEYSGDSVTIDQGEALFFRNLDINQRHDIVSVMQSGGKPIFSTPLIGTGEEALVQNSQSLKGGSFEFFCSIHPFMRATLIVTGAPGPPPPPPDNPPPSGGGDTQAPSVSLRIVDTKLSQVKKSRKLRVQVTTNEAGNVSLTATVKSGKKTVTIARSTQGFAGTGRKTVSMALTKAGQSALRNRSSATITVRGTATDGAGNAGRGSTSRTLKK
jgi:plastocyanin